MASAHIEISGTANARHNAQARYLLDRLQQDYEDMTRLVNVFGQTFPAQDSGAALAELLSMPAEDAVAFYNLLVSAHGELGAAPFFQQLLSRCG